MSKEELSHIFEKNVVQMANLTKIPRVRFNLKQRKIKNSETPIILVFRYRDFTVRIYTGLTICPADWSDKRQRPVEREGRRDLTAISRELDRTAQITKDVFIENSFGAILPADLKQEVLIRTGRMEEPEEEKRPTMLDFFDQELTAMERTYKKSSYKVFSVAVKRLREYLSDEGLGNFDFDNVDWNFRHSFVQWCYEVKGYYPATVNTYLSSFTLLLNKASEKGLHTNITYTLRGWKEKTDGDDGPPIYLTVPELEKLARLALEGREKTVRDLFLIGVMTGQRWSDYHRYKPEDFIEEDGEKLLRVRQEKTGTGVYLPLDLFDGIIESKTLTGLFDEYDWRSPKVPYRFFNAILKDLAKRTGLNHSVLTVTRAGNEYKEVYVPKWQTITSHCARRTFCTLLYKKGVPKSKIMYGSGHKTETQFEKYIGVTAKEGALSLAAELRRMRGESLLRVAK